MPGTGKTATTLEVIRKIMSLKKENRQKRKNGD
jgi:Cdc6-like AAA superfamily ATPase